VLTGHDSSSNFVSRWDLATLDSHRSDVVERLLLPDLLYLMLHDDSGELVERKIKHMVEDHVGTLIQGWSMSLHAYDYDMAFNPSAAMIPIDEIWKNTTGAPHKTGSDSQECTIKDARLSFLHLACNFNLVDIVEVVLTKKPETILRMFRQRRDGETKDASSHGDEVKLASPLQVALAHRNMEIARKLIQAALSSWDLVQDSERDSLLQETWTHVADYLISGRPWKGRKDMNALLGPYSSSKMRIQGGTLLHFVSKYGFGNQRLSKALLANVDWGEIYKKDDAGKYPEDRKGLDTALESDMLLLKVYAMLEAMQKMDGKDKFVWIPPGKHGLRGIVDFSGKSAIYKASAPKDLVAQVKNAMSGFPQELMNGKASLSELTEVPKGAKVLRAQIWPEAAQSGNLGGVLLEVVPGKQEFSDDLHDKAMENGCLLQLEGDVFRGNPVALEAIKLLDAEISNGNSRPEFFLNAIFGTKRRTLWHYASLAALPDLLEWLIARNRESREQETEGEDLWESDIWRRIVWRDPFFNDSTGENARDLKPWATRRKFHKSMEDLKAGVVKEERARLEDHVSDLVKVTEQRYEAIRKSGCFDIEPFDVSQSLSQVRLQGDRVPRSYDEARQVAEVACITLWEAVEALRFPGIRLAGRSTMLKERERAEEKVTCDYANNWGGLKDMVRIRVFCADWVGMQRFYDALVSCQSGSVVRVKNNFTTGKPAYYRFATVNYDLAFQHQDVKLHHICEIQFHHEELGQSVMEEWHTLYENIRRLPKSLQDDLQRKTFAARLKAETPSRHATPLPTSPSGKATDALDSAASTAMSHPFLSPQHKDAPAAGATSLASGDVLRVDKRFISDGGYNVDLPVGASGTVKLVDAAGDAQVEFSGVGSVWIFRKNFGNVSKVDHNLWV